MKFHQIKLICTFVLLVALIAFTIIQISESLVRSNTPQVSTQVVPVAIAQESSKVYAFSPPFVDAVKPNVNSNTPIPPQPNFKKYIPPLQPITLPPKPSQYGHLPYSEASPETLKDVGKYYDRFERLHSEATKVFKEMQAKARSDGIGLIPISGFRTIADQELLFSRQIKRQGSREAAASLSAPPGFSEHHTGYAIDIGEESNPATDLKFDFEYTQAYRWLNKNARAYGFRLSFPRNNSQGVRFEPWHWRYVASPSASKIFTRAQKMSG
jgi:D-alanyl-D-alanine carboxypeptidase